MAFFDGRDDYFSGKGTDDWQNMWNVECVCSSGMQHSCSSGTPGTLAQIYGASRTKGRSREEKDGGWIEGGGAKAGRKDVALWVWVDSLIV